MCVFFVVSGWKTQKIQKKVERWTKRIFIVIFFNIKFYTLWRSACGCGRGWCFWERGQGLEINLIRGVKNI